MEAIIAILVLVGCMLLGIPIVFSFASMVITLSIL